MQQDKNKTVTIESEKELDQLFCLDETFGLTPDELYDASSNDVDIFSSIHEVLDNNPNLHKKELLLSIKPPYAHEYTLVLDLDDTLVHCYLNSKPKIYDYEFTVFFSISKDIINRYLK